MKNKHIAIFSLLIATLSVVSLSYFKGLHILGTRDTKSMENVRGIILPHHDLADELIISTLSEVSQNNSYDRIVVIGPNHFYPENPLIVSGKSLQDFPIEVSLIEQLDATFEAVTLNQKVLEAEHSMIIPIKYLREYFPDATYVPLIVSSYYSPHELDGLSSHISQYDSENTLWVLAIDFAHNVGLDEGLAQNDKSIEAISSFDYNTILSYTDTNLDSPVGTALFLKILEARDYKRWTTLHSTHGSVIEGVSDLNGTSYVIGIFQE